jgi:phospholipid transport system substrate-binding protein
MRSFALLQRRWAVLVGALLLLVGAGPASEAAPTDQLRAHVDRVLRILKNPELRNERRTPDRRTAIRAIAHALFDFEETAKRALGPHWRARTPAERKVFVQLFTDLLERVYIGRIERYRGQMITYVDESTDEGRALVKTRIVTQQGAEVPIDYRMHRKGDRWLVYDVLIEGVSLVANYRTQFNRIIRTSSYEKLVGRIKTTVSSAEERATEQTTPLRGRAQDP